MPCCVTGMRLRWCNRIGHRGHPRQRILMGCSGSRKGWRHHPVNHIGMTFNLKYINYIMSTIQKLFLFWISRSLKKGASDNTISYFDQSFRFSGLWLILARDLGRSGQNKSWGTEENRERTRSSVYKILNSELKKKINQSQI